MSDWYTKRKRYVRLRRFFITWCLLFGSYDVLYLAWGAFFHHPYAVVIAATSFAVLLLALWVMLNVNK